MFRRMLAVLAVGLGVAAFNGSASAQDMPFPDIMGLAYQNYANDQMMNAWTWQQACALAKTLPPGTQLQHDHGRFQQSMAEGRSAFDGYLRGAQANSARTMNALDRYDHEAIRGESLYTGEYGGPGYYLPHSYPAYNVNSFGVAVPGVNHFQGTNVYPVWGW